MRHACINITSEALSKSELSVRRFPGVTSRLCEQLPQDGAALQISGRMTGLSTAAQTAGQSEGQGSGD